MTLRLRQRHRLAWAILGLALPLGFAVGVVWRPTFPQQLAAVPEPATETQLFTATDYERGDWFGKAPVRVRLWREQGTARLAIGLAADKDFVKPDLLVYWSAVQIPESGALPGNAKLLGAFAAGPLVLPPEASTANGRVILFSLANQEIVDVSQPIRFDDSIP